jgi:hypothetical protein
VCRPPVVEQRPSQLLLAKILRHAAGALEHSNPQRHKAVLANAARAGEIAIRVAEAFPWTDRCEVRRAKRSRAPLAQREVGDTV